MSVIMIVVLVLILYNATCFQDAFESLLIYLKQIFSDDNRLSHLERVQIADYLEDNSDHDENNVVTTEVSETTVDEPEAKSEPESKAKSKIQNGLNNSYIDKVKEKVHEVSTEDNNHTFATTLLNGYFKEFVKNSIVQNIENDTKLFNKLPAVFLSR